MPNTTRFARYQQRASAVLLCGCLLTACGGTALRTDDQAAGGAQNNPVGVAGAGGQGPAGSAGASAAGASAAGAAGSTCASGLPSAVEIASTPRADQNLELLALRLSGGIIADQGTYDRVVRDVGAIRGQAQRVADISYFPRQDGKSILLDPDAATFAAMQAGNYHGWDCLNQAYVVKNTALDQAKPPSTSLVELTLKGIYDLATVAKQYEAVTGVKASQGGSGGGDASTICVTLEANAWHYVFDEASGDCPAGCTEHIYSHFTTNEAGAVTDLGQIPASEDSPYTSYAACQ